MAQNSLAPVPAVKVSARDRLLAAATELFYAEGVISVGIDRVIERAGVAKASLYNSFGSKDALIAEYLGQRTISILARIHRYIDPLESPRAKLLGIFDAQNEIITSPRYRGCAFVNASAETRPGSVIQDATTAYRDALRGLLSQLAAELDAGDADVLAEQLLMLYDGASVTAKLDRNINAAKAARSVAALLIDASTPS